MRKVLKKNLGLTLVVGLIVVLGSAALVMRGAGASVVVPAGDDTFTTPNDAQTFDNFSSHPIPAGFFGPGSLAYTGVITLKGGPPVDSTRWGSADTVIHRLNDVTVPGDTGLSVQGLSFVSASPITVDYEDGHSEQWDVSVGQSASTCSAGSMTFNSDGTFNSSLSIYPQYTFTSAGHAPVTLDTGAGGGPAPIKLSSNNGKWSQVGTATVIDPGAEQSLLASHHINPPPPPSPTPTPSPTPVPCPSPGIMSSSSGTRATSTQTAISKCVEVTAQQ
jgi:hypothetical protein